MIKRDKLFKNFFQMNKSLDSYAFGDKLMLANAGCIHIGYSQIEKNELQFDGNKYFTIQMISFHNWVDLLYKVVKLGETTSSDANNIIMFDSFDMKKEYHCKIDLSNQSISIVKKFDSKEVIIISKREAVEILYMLSFFIISCLGLPPVIGLCFSQIINHFSEECFVISPDDDSTDCKKIESEITNLSPSDFLDICSSVVAFLNLEIDSYVCFHSLMKFQNLILPLVKMRLIKKKKMD